jgi:hypothetical protein
MFSVQRVRREPESMMVDAGGLSMPGMRGVGGGLIPNSTVE